MSYGNEAGQSAKFAANLKVHGPISYAVKSLKKNHQALAQNIQACLYKLNETTK